ncbi:MAG: sialate O-acetylesterase [Akkermansia sp.]
MTWLTIINVPEPATASLSLLGLGACSCAAGESKFSSCRAAGGFMRPAALFYPFESNCHESTASLYRSLLFIPITAAFIGAAEAKTLQLYILTGQSNSLGAVKGSPASMDAGTVQVRWKHLPWHNNFNKITGSSVDCNPPASSSWGSIVPQVCGTESSNYNCMGPEYGFAAMMERKGWSWAAWLRTCGHGNRQGRSGRRRHYWNKGTNAYNAIVETVRKACENALANGYDKVEIMGVMYLQGESNTVTDSSNAANSFLTFLDNLQGDLARDGVDTGPLAAHQAILGEQAKWGTDQRHEC